MYSQLRDKHYQQQGDHRDIVTMSDTACGRILPDVQNVCEALRMTLSQDQMTSPQVCAGSHVWVA